jgi:hypothetical protein
MREKQPRLQKGKIIEAAGFYACLFIIPAGIVLGKITGEAHPGLQESAYIASAAALLVSNFLSNSEETAPPEPKYENVTLIEVGHEYRKDRAAV